MVSRVDGRLEKDGAARVAHVVACFVYYYTLSSLGAIDVPDH